MSKVFIEGQHHAIDDLNNVHSRMIAKFELKKRATVDEKRAKKMEQYLRMFKALGNQNSDKIKPSFQLSLEEQAMQDIAEQVGQQLGIKNYSLFRMQHLWYRDSSQRWGADDVFEAELAKLLNVAGEKAINNINGSIDFGVNLIGGQTGNVSKEGLEQLLKLPEEISKNFMKTGDSAIRKSIKDSSLITPPTFRSAKVDVTGYNAEWTIGAEIKPEWEDFIKVFTGARFTVKNYSSASKNEVIHIGNSDLYKAFYGTLTDSLNFKPKEAIHIYYHTINSEPEKDPEESQHVIHIRFTYELTGNGLYDQDGNKIDAADFFIYNDPSSNNIWVRSTKSMIAHVMDYAGQIRNPLHSGIVILKQSFD